MMGLGLHGGGVGTVKFLSEAGAQIIATDIKSKEELALSLEKLKGIKNVSFILGQHRPEDFTETDLVIKNPAVPWNNKYIKLALDKKIPVEMDSSLFFKLCKNKIIGVTGTKGKTTTSKLIYTILKTAKKDAVEAGISQTSVLDKLKNLEKETLVVFELSSWRLSALGRSKISPQISVITNIYPDHLNYYKSMPEYIADKENIFLYQKKNDICVINAGNVLLEKSRCKIPSQIVEFSREKIISGSGAFIEDGSMYFKNGESKNKILNISEIKLKGAHNQENILAAVAVAGMLGIDFEIIKKGILGFLGTPHRLELVRELEGVEYYNDSAATTPESAISGINSFSEPVVLICGGANKNLNVSMLAKEISKKVKSIIFLAGESTDKIIEELRKEDENKNTEFEIVNSMEKAVELARREVQAGDIILLSPGASSFGLFINEFDRGDQFREIVKKLK